MMDGNITIPGCHHYRSLRLLVFAVCVIIVYRYTLTALITLSVQYAEQQTPDVLESSKQHIQWQSPEECPPQMHYLSGTDLPTTALVSAPGAGNTWLRQLLEMATGNHTYPQTGVWFFLLKIPLLSIFLNTK